MIIKTEPFINGAHANQSRTPTTIPEGWAVVPDGFCIPDTFPFVNIEVENGIVSAMTAAAVPGSDPSVPSCEDDLLAMAADHEYRLILLELGVNE